MMTFGGALALFLLCTTNLVGRSAESPENIENRKTGIQSTVLPGIRIDYNSPGRKALKPVCKRRESCLTTHDDTETEDYPEIMLLNSVSFCDCPENTFCDRSNPLKMGDRTFSFCGQPSIKKCRPNQLATSTIGLSQIVHCICPYELEMTHTSAELIGRPDAPMNEICKKRNSKYFVKKVNRPKVRLSAKDILDYLEQ
ncbi:unnamed protein product [Bursaphelenchus xylophilus]|uniref:(pine wood nematode) hypothetical protein n=1 Tax=Bursaphelenchus xylophilus TaxID=6326 RepID=A0A1I7S005_BURXY|nr:unnamed protein product [Bursaphelenchus xylophilus]CAG9109108.1 unnamed protein product [Bursaphelenchus xylophilus]